MAQILNLNTLHAATRAESNGLQLSNATHYQNVNQQWTSLQRKLNCNGRFSCLFSDNRREEQARKALESALGGKKNEFEKWNKEIEKREEAGGGDAGGGGWFGQGGRFGWSDGDHFWQEAQQTCLAVLGIVIMYLIVAKGELMLAVVFNPLLYCLRGIRNGFSTISSIIQRKSSLDIPAHLADMSRKEVYSGVSAKERVLRKWGNE